VTDVRIHLGARRATDDDVLSALAAIRRPPTRDRELPEPAQGARLRCIEAEVNHVEDEELRSIVLDARRRLNM
jgi:hypothetical protein